MTIENKLFEKIKTGKKINLERAILISYGYNAERELTKYRAKINELNKAFRKFASKKLKVKRKTARALYEFLWQEPDRKVYGAMHAFRLGNGRKKRSLTETEELGECVRRTALYSLMGVRQGLNTTILYNGGHVLSRLRIGKRIVDIENTCEDGFDGFDILAQGSRRIAYEGLKEAGLIDLLGLTYKNRGNIESEKERWAKAITYYGKAIHILPNYASIYNCRGMAKEKLGRIQQAIKDYNKAIEIDPQNINAYKNRGEAKLKIKDMEGAEKDLEKSKRLMNVLMARRSLTAYF